MKNVFTIVMLSLMVLAFGCSKNPIQKGVDEWNKELPQQVDDGMVWTKVEYDESQEALLYYYDIDPSTFELVNNDDGKKYLKLSFANDFAADSTIMELDVRKLIFEFNNQKNDESFTIDIIKSDIDSLVAEAEIEKIRAMVDDTRSGLPKQLDDGVEWTDISYDSSIGQVTFTYTISENLYNYIDSDSAVAQSIVDEIIQALNEDQDLKELNVQSYSFQYNTDNGKNFSFTKTWSEIFE